MARTGRIEGGAVRPAASRIRGCRRVAWEPGSSNAQALPCPPVFRPSARVRWSNCRSWWVPSPGPWLLARRLGEARRPGSGVGVVLDPGPLRSAAFVRASFSARRGVRLGCRNCSVRPVRAGFSGTCGVRLGAGAGSLRSVRSSGRPARRARCSTRCRETSPFTRGPARRRSRERAARRARCSTRCRRTGAVLLSEPDPGVVPLGGGRAGGASRRARCSTRCRRTGRFTWWRAWRPLRSGGGPAAGWRQRNCCPARTAGARRTASRRRRPFR